MDKLFLSPLKAVSCTIFLIYAGPNVPLAPANSLCRVQL